MNKILEIYQPKEGYRYNSDTLILYDFIGGLNPKGKVLEVGSGCGILGLLLGRDYADIMLSQIEIQKQHYELTCKNLLHNSINSDVICADFISYDFESDFDMIVSNPPFYHKGVLKSQNEALHVSRHSDALPFDLMVKKVAKCLKNRGDFVFCYDAKQIDALHVELIKNKMKPVKIRFVHPKTDKNASLVLVQAKKNAKSLCEVMPPFLPFCADEPSKEMSKLQKRANTLSVDI